MITLFYKKLRLFFLMFLYLKKYNGIWGFKKYISQVDNPAPQLLEFYDAYFRRYGSWIGYKSQLDGEPCFPHGFHGVFISNGAKLGRNNVIFQHVVIGSNTLNDTAKGGSPTIGDNVYIGAGAKIIGKIVIGDNCRIGANAVVYEDMPPHSVAIQSPTRILRKTNLDNRFYSRRNGRWFYFRDGNWIEDSDRIN